MNPVTAFWILFALISLLALIWILQVVREDEPTKEQEESGWWRALMFSLALVALFGVVGGRDRDQEADWRAEQTAAIVAATIQSITDKHCPPEDGESLPLVTLHIRVQADDKPEIFGCTRYLKRPFVPRGKQANPVKLVSAQ